MTVLAGDWGSVVGNWGIDSRWGGSDTRSSEGAVVEGSNGIGEPWRPWCGGADGEGATNLNRAAARIFGRGRHTPDASAY